MMTWNDNLPASGQYYPAVAKCTLGSHTVRAHAALVAIGEPVTLGQVAYRADLSMTDAAEAIVALCRRGIVRLEEVPGYTKHGVRYEPVTRIHLVAAQAPRDGLFEDAHQNGHSGA